MTGSNLREKKMPEITIDTTPLNQEDEISIREVLSVLTEQKVFILLFCLSSILTALALTYIASEKYESAITISFKPQKVIRFKAHESEAFGAPLPVPPFELISKNLNELVHSENLLRSVVIELNLDKEIKGPTGGPWYLQAYRATKTYVLNLSNNIWMIMKYGRLIEEDPVFAATKALRKNVSFVDKSSYIFYIVVRDKYPKRAPLIVNSIARHLVEQLHKDQKSPGNANKLQLKELLNTKMGIMQSLKTELENLLTQNTIVSLSLEAEQSMTRWSSLELERVQLEGDIKKIQASLSNAKQYSANKQTNKKTKRSSSQYILPEDFKKLSSDRLFGSIELKGLVAKHRSIVSEIKNLEAKLKNLPAIKNRIEHLKSQIEIVKRDFVQVSDAYQEALILSTTALIEAEILHAATSPQTPVAPVKIYNVGLAALLSLFIGIALVYLLSYAEIYLLFSPKKDASDTKDISLKADTNHADKDKPGIEKSDEENDKDKPGITKSNEEDNKDKSGIKKSDEEDDKDKSGIKKSDEEDDKGEKGDRRLNVVPINFDDRRTGRDRRAS